MLDYLLDLYQENQDYSLLFSCIDFCKLKKHKLTEFAKKVNFNDLDQNTWINIWTNISEYLENTASKNCLLIQFNENADFCGKIHYLKYTKKIGISITSTPPFSEYYSEVNNIIDFEDADNTPLNIPQITKFLFPSLGSMGNAFKLLKNEKSFDISRNFT